MQGGSSPLPSVHLLLLLWTNSSKSHLRKKQIVTCSFLLWGRHFQRAAANAFVLGSFTSNTSIVSSSAAFTSMFFSPHWSALSDSKECHFQDGYLQDVPVQLFLALSIMQKYCRFNQIQKKQANKVFEHSGGMSESLLVVFSGQFLLCHLNDRLSFRYRWLIVLQYLDGCRILHRGIMITSDKIKLLC